MSEIDEGLDEILNQYHMGSFSTRNRAKQDILDLMCKLRGCKPEGTKNIFHPELGRMEKLGKGPCEWCGKKQP